MTTNKIREGVTVAWFWLCFMVVCFCGTIGFAAAVTIITAITLGHIWAMRWFDGHTGGRDMSLDEQDERLVQFCELPAHLVRAR